MVSKKIIIEKPLVTEKSTDLGSIGKYVFKVNRGATKTEIKKEISKIYNVDIVKVNIVRNKGKTRTFRNIKGRKLGYKKAIVTVEPGKKIEIS